MNDERTDARACLITPPGEGGISVIALAGPGAVKVLAACFQGSRRAADEIAPGVIAHGRIVRDARTVDEVIVARLAAHQSHAGETIYEVNCHGGAAATAGVLECLHVAGAQVVPWQAFCAPEDLRTAVLSEAAIRASALALLPRARTRLAARMLLHQAQGALSRALEAMFERHSESVGENLEADILTEANGTLRRIESFWLQQLGFGPRVSEFSRVETAA